jgi:cellulose synthase/poly-beta-1,6-N-acetylglucosamine synthase-like glycosyltransferase
VISFADKFLPFVEPTALVVTSVVICAGLVQNFIYFVQLVVAYTALRKRPPVRRSQTLWAAYVDVAPPIALLVPAYNEEATVVENVRSILSLHYPDFEVIVVNDGSKDRTLAVLIEAFELQEIERPFENEVEHKAVRGLYGASVYPNLTVVDKENGGKSDALNAAINVSHAPLFCAVDADSLLEADSLLRSLQPFIDEPERAVVVGGTIRVVNGCDVRAGRVRQIGLPTQLLPLIQTVEYLRAFLMARLAWSRMRSLTIVSGAFGIFRRNIAIAVGGYSHGTVGEDFEIILKIHRYMRERDRDYLIEFIPEPVCWTEVPVSLSVLAKQRIRWQRGALETFTRHKDMLFNPRYGRVGVLGLGNILLQDVIIPPLEIIGYLLVPLFWALEIIDWNLFAAFLALTFCFGIVISVGALVLEEIELRRFARARDLMLLLLVAIFENFGYRQLNTIWRILGHWHFLRGSEGWGDMTRIGFKKD